MLLPLLVVAHVVAAASARRLVHSLPDDLHAFPKSRVVFLSAQPLLNDTAQRWLAQGLRGGELEFLDQPWNSSPSRSLKEIESGPAESHDPVDPPANYSLELMKMGPAHSYLCFIPKAAPTPPAPTEEEETDELTFARSWSLLQPLSGTCLYHRQGWFTYSYCHNLEVRQFKEATQAHPSSPGGYRPEEDPEWEAYSLGKAPRPGADLTVAEQNARAENLELARSAGSRYLVQRWGDGTLCDKTGRPREVEVQFHCSMTMTDTILFVKEARTCAYVVVIHTPRLCGEPGFRTRRDAGEEAQIRCREIVAAKPAPAGGALVHASDAPAGPPRAKPVPPPPVREKNADREKYNAMLRKALGAIAGTKDMGGMVLSGEGGDEVVIEVLGEDFMTEEQVGAVDKITEALRAAGYDIKAEKANKKKDERKKGQPVRKQRHHDDDEL